MAHTPPSFCDAELPTGTAAGPATGVRCQPSVADWLRLAHTPGLGPRRITRLLQQYGSPAQALKAGPQNWSERGIHVGDGLPGWEEQRDQQVQDDLQWAAQSSRHRILSLDDPDYPPLLREIPDPPPVLYLRGDFSLLRTPQIAIVGSRDCTPQGVVHASRFARVLAEAGVTITSGLAAGIDTSAHQAALSVPQGRTIAVMATGPDRVYPKSNRRLAHRLADHGLLVALWPVGTNAQGNHFPQRNRVISGLTLGTLIVEAAERSGSLITARLASEQGRSVYAIPGSILSRVSRGCHKLIQEGAQLVQSPDDILEDLAAWLGVPPERAPAPPASDLFTDLSPEQERLLRCMGHDPVDIETLITRSGLTVEVVCSILTLMELNGRVATLGQNHYQRLDAGSL